MKHTKDVSDDRGETTNLNWGFQHKQYFKAKPQKN